ncbi:MAG: hypothetical protein IIC60_02595 [Proteobacteria bacterium]|nr:hypothetical protein [Pseudomonadota bacterium]
MWQSIYEELKSDNFEIISVAEDTGGEAAAGPIFDAANVTYTSIIDVNHHISALYNLVNVPSGIWIDEEGKIVRINEGTYAKSHGAFGTDDYAPIVRDWAANGADSPYVWDLNRVREGIFQRTEEAERAQPAFRLGTYYFTRDNEEKAEKYFNLAQELDPDSWNYLRQDIHYEEGGSAGPQWRARRAAEENRGETYYAPLDIEPQPPSGN